MDEPPAERKSVKPDRDWNIWVDVGGTFTDAVALGPDGSFSRAKILSTSALRGTVESRLSPSRLGIAESWRAPAGFVRGFRFRLLGVEHAPLVVEAYDPATRSIELSGPLDVAAAIGSTFEVLSEEDAPLLAARLLTGTPGDRALPPARMRLATTRGTNALLERTGSPTALFITRGFGDLLRIGTQQRPELFELDIRRPAPLYTAVVEVDERLDSKGRVIRPLEADDLNEQIDALLDRGIRVGAVALLHGYLDPVHERLVGRRLLERGFEHVSCSHELAPSIKLLPRARTTVVDAYLSPLLRNYVDRVAAALSSDSLLLMTSAGGLLDPDGFRPKDSLLSGPAGGVVGAALAGRRSGLPRVISFDMGGTSTDVARFDGDYEYVYEHRVGQAELVAPALAIETVAAGGGSVCWVDGERLRVGPHSAGAHPGPACYGAGGPLTLTDANLLLGRIDPRRFEIPIHAEPARARLDELLDELTRRTGQRPTDEDVLQGLLVIANETMADAIRRVSLRRGFDPASYALVAFGGAGAQHACGIASRLGIRRIAIPADAALLSALGLGRAVVERFVERQVLAPLDEVAADLPDWFEQLAEQARDAVASVGVASEKIEVRRRILQLRFAGQDASLEVEWQPGRSSARAFEQKYRTLFGHRPERRPVELDSLRVVASARADAEADCGASGDATRPEPSSAARAHFEQGWLEVGAFDRETLPSGAIIEGPALVQERHSATVIEPGWRASVDAAGALILEHGTPATSADERQRPEAVRLELFTQRFSTLVREMGERLERTAVSTNVKERLDFSCALLDPQGELVVNAPHIPVHLGALGLCVRTIRDRIALEPGDVVVTNHPAYGGSHLPDVTVVTPAYSPDRPGELIGYLASRAHHAEIGGSRPGSMPPAATCLAEEGVVIPPMHLVRRGRARWAAMRRLLAESRYPSRAIEDNLADLRAAVAANHSGVVALQALARTHGDETIRDFMERLEALAERRIREALSGMRDGDYEATEALDDGTEIRARIEIRDDRARIDFGGTSGRHPGNLNATRAIVQSAVLYVLRLLLREPLPLNEGLLRAVTIDLPSGLLAPEFCDDPFESPAVVGGNVETSQRLVDTLLKALGIAACSQGTMNNLLFGGTDYGYYETLGGGVGAGPGYHGASGVHSHMTNTRITDPEILEHRYPVRVERFAIRRGSGGAGRYRGGDGLVREIRFLDHAEVSILSQHRRVAPYGLDGGLPGACGEQRVIRADGHVERLGAIDECEVERGDRLVVETPGGGGYGRTCGKT